MLCTVCNCILLYMNLPHFFSVMVPAYTPDLNLTEGICIDPTYFKCKSKSCRGVMVIQSDLCRIWYIANMFSSCFLCFLLSKRHLLLLLQRGTAVASKSGTFTFFACNIYFFPLLWKSLLKSLSEIKEQTQEWYFRVISFFLSLW